MEAVELATPTGGRCIVLAVAQGLVSEADAVEAALRDTTPQHIGIQLDPDEVGGVLSWEVVAPEAPEDKAYSDLLGRFGEVELPPPDIHRAVAMAPELGAEVVGIDVGELSWTEEFTRRISGMALINRGLRMRRGGRKLRTAGTPETLCRMWDARANKPPFDGLEGWREAEMAHNIATLCDGAQRTAIVLEVARADGVLAHLERSGFRRL